MNLTEMTEAELNERASLALCGPWDESRCHVCGWPIDDEVDWMCRIDNCSMRPPPEIRADAPGDFCNDIELVFRLQAEIEKRGLQKQYHLKLIGVYQREGNDNGPGWFLINATPRQRTIAFLLATEGK